MNKVLTNFSREILNLSAHKSLIADRCQQTPTTHHPRDIDVNVNFISYAYTRNLRSTRKREVSKYVLDENLLFPCGYRGVESDNWVL